MRIQCNIAGITFRNNGTEFESVKPEGFVQFVHDPKNAFDPNAIEVHYNKLMLGYVKKDSYAQEFLKDHPDVCEAAITNYAYAEGSGAGLVFNQDHKGRLSALSFEIVHGEDDVVLTEDNRYIINGKEYDRLSNVTSHFDPEPDNPGLDRWKIDHKDYKDYMDDLNGRARAGTAMHNAIECYIETGQTDVLIPNGFFNFVEKHEVEFDGTEILMVCDEYGIAGRADAKANVMDGPKKKRVPKYVLIDWKSSKKPTKIHAIKTAWYAVEQGCEEAWVVAFGAETKQGYSLMKVDCTKIARLHKLVRLVSVCKGLLNG